MENTVVVEFFIDPFARIFISLNFKHAELNVIIMLMMLR